MGDLRAWRSGPYVHYGYPRPLTGYRAGLMATWRGARFLAARKSAVQWSDPDPLDDLRRPPIVVDP